MKTNRSSAFTLLELLTVIGIIGILAAITIPNLGAFKPNVMAAGVRQLVDDVARARQLAIVHRTTVYMVFVPADFLKDPAYAALPPADRVVAETLTRKRLIAYNFVSLRSLGDQPGRPTVRYLAEWKNLPEGVYVPPEKFVFDPANPAMVRITIQTNNSTPPPELGVLYEIPSFPYTNSIPFPVSTAASLLVGGRATWVSLPYLAFNYLGQLESGEDQVIPLVLGRAATQSDGIPIAQSAISFTNQYNVVHINWLTGRARIEQPEVR